MKGMIDRRRFVAFIGTTGLVGAAGCTGEGEQPNDESVDPNDEDDADGTDDTDDTDDQPGEQGEAEPFDFPPGADENGLVTETVVAGGRQFLVGTDRYRLTQTHELDCSDAPRDEMEIAYDVEGRTVRERLLRDGVEIDRWITPERTLAQSADVDGDRTDRWRTETVDPMLDSSDSSDEYPFEKTTVPALLESASFEFDEIVTEAKQSYARYSGEIVSTDPPELRQPDTARIDYQLESASEGSVTMLLAENGAIHAVEYDFAGEVTRLTREGREAVGLEASGEVRLESGEDLDAVTKPEWVETSDSADVREFELTETSLGRTYKLVSGPSLPGSVDLEYSEFYLTAQFGEDRYIARYIPRTEFDGNAGVVANFDDGELQFDWASISGRDALVDADRIEMSVYLRTPDEGRSMVFHEERHP